MHGGLSWPRFLAMNNFTDTAPAKAATRDDDDEESNDDPHHNHTELSQTFEALFRWICDIVDDADVSFVCQGDDGRCFRFVLSIDEMEQECGENRGRN